MSSAQQQMPSPSPTPPPASNPSSATTAAHDIHSTYLNTLRTSPLPPTLAAILALSTSLTSTPLATISETLALLSSLSTALASSVTNPTPLQAGTDLFQRYLLTSLHRAPSTSTSTPTSASNLDATTPASAANITAAAQAFIDRALAARAQLATHGARLIPPHATVLLPAPSRAATALLLAAATLGVRFRVAAVSVSAPAALARQHEQLTRLTAAGVPVALVPAAGVSRALEQLTRPVRDPRPDAPVERWDGPVLVLAGAAALLANGDVLAALGTRQCAVLAREAGVRVLVAAESYKCTRVAAVPDGEAVRFDMDGSAGVDGARGDVAAEEGNEDDEPLDVTPAALVAGIVTEAGVQGPAAVAEEAVRVWF